MNNAQEDINSPQIQGNRHRAIYKSDQLAYRFKLVNNDGRRQSAINLIQLKNLISKGLPVMNKEHIAKLVMDQRHQSIIIEQMQGNGSRCNKIVGGVTFRVFQKPNFAEIAFLVVKYEKRIRGYGRKLINKLKDLMQSRKIQYLLTFGDNLALGFFKKQGFTQKLTMERQRWQGYIKQYEGGKLMQYYLRINEIIKSQKYFLIQKIKEISTNQIQFSSTKIPKPTEFHRVLASGEVQKYRMDPRLIPGVIEAGWSWQEHDSLKKINQLPFESRCRMIIDNFKRQPQSWPFLEPVSIKIVPDYLLKIEKPMDLKTIESKLENSQYKNQQEFCQDIKLIFSNCKQYNNQDTIYYKNGIRLEKMIIPALDDLKKKVITREIKF